MSEMNAYVSHAYRIGWWTHRWWPRMVILRCLLTARQPDGRPATRRYYLGVVLRDLRRLKRPHRPWQAEDESGQHRFARRAFTSEGAVRLMARDVAFYERTGRKSLYQRRCLWWVQTRCRKGWHRWYDLRHGRACLTCGLPADGPFRSLS
jgi:hypothetical protein